MEEEIQNTIKLIEGTNRSLEEQLAFLRKLGASDNDEEIKELQNFLDVSTKGLAQVQQIMSMNTMSLEQKVAAVHMVAQSVIAA